MDVFNRVRSAFNTDADYRVGGRQGRRDGRRRNSIVRRRRCRGASHVRNGYDAIPSANGILKTIIVVFVVR